MTLRLFSEPYPSTGSIDGRASRRAIGRSSLDPWAVLLRETLQNSWDARLRPDGPVRFSVDADGVTPQQRRLLREELFTTPPLGLPLTVELADPKLSVLLITDRDTLGLAGSTRADREDVGEPTNFVDFIRNVGRDKSKGYQGGTYGFGKGILFELSRCATLVAFTRTTHHDRPVSRLIGMALGDQFTDGGRRFTGRHWWGIPGSEVDVEPDIGRSAEHLADALGLTSRLPPGDTGTALMILAPATDGSSHDLDAVIARIVSAAAWFAWPHLPGAAPGTGSIHLSFSSRGEKVAAPQPSSHPVLRHYMAAYRHATALLDGIDSPAGSPWTVRELRSDRPARRLGAFAHRPYNPQGAPDGPGIPAGVGSAVALMRAPRFVVRYLSVVPPEPNVATAGVFLADPVLDEAFARAEPATHDDWLPANLELEKFERNPVRQALERVREAARPSRDSGAPIAGESASRGLTVLSSALGDLLVAQTGTDLARGDLGEDSRSGGASADPGSPKSPTRDGLTGSQTAANETIGRHDERPRPRSPRGRVDLDPDPVLISTDGLAAVDFGFTVAAQGRVTVTAEARVVLDGGHIETPADAPLGAPVPRLLGWVVNGQVQQAGPSALTIEPGDDRRWSARISQPAQTAVTVLLRLGQDQP